MEKNSRKHSHRRIVAGRSHFLFNFSQHNYIIFVCTARTTYEFDLIKFNVIHQIHNRVRRCFITYRNWTSRYAYWTQPQHTSQPWMLNAHNNNRIGLDAIFQQVLELHLTAVDVCSQRSNCVRTQSFFVDLRAPRWHLTYANQNKCNFSSRARFFLQSICTVLKKCRKSLTNLCDSCRCFWFDFAMRAWRPFVAYR